MCMYGFLLGISAIFSDQKPSCQDTIADGEALEAGHREAGLGEAGKPRGMHEMHEMPKK